MKLKLLIFSLILINCDFVLSQNTRQNEYNAIGWYSYFGTLKLDKKLSIHSEYQLRRDNYITDKQQGLLRVGINYQLNSKSQLRFGYAWIETFSYSETPINSFGKDFTEHRTFQALTISDKTSIVDLSHRFMLEQRWIGRYSNAFVTKEDDFLFLNRLRYMFRAQLTLAENKSKYTNLYLAAYDEIFIGFGKNVNENIFDQNRIGVLLGYKFNKTVRMEAGYLNQTLQLGREINNRNVFQNNNGFIINTHINIDLSKNNQL